MLLTPNSKQGNHGTLYRYCVTYRDFDPDGYRGSWIVFAYDAEDAVNKFYEYDDDTGWTVVSVARAHDLKQSEVIAW